MNETILRPLLPLNTEKSGDACVCSMWGRRYRVENTCLLSSVCSQEEELLSGPMRIVGTENGKDFALEDIQTFIMAGANDVRATVCTAAASRHFAVNTQMVIEYDGCIDCTVSVMPKGKTAAQCLGIEETDPASFELTRLWIEIPLKREKAMFYHVYPAGDILLDGQPPEGDEQITQAGLLPQRLMEMSFREQVYLGNDDTGFAVFFESDENWQPESPQQAIECVVSEKEVTLRLRLLDSEPSRWSDKGDDGGQDLFPTVFRFGMQATPVKPFPQNPYDEHSLHLGCGKHYTAEYDELLIQPFEGDPSGEWLIDRMHRLGVDTLYIHEKWNDIQNSTDLTEDTVRRLKTIIELAHSRNMKVIPYFGYELSSLSPLFGKNHTDMRLMCNQNNYAWHWYRKPYQRDVFVCYNSDYQDYFVKGVERLIDTYGFDGIYLDTTIKPMPCLNEAHGCGYRTDKGELKRTYSVWAIRRLMKRLYEAVDSRGGIINAHTAGAFNIPALAFTHSVWEGEQIQGLMIKDRVAEFPEAYFRAWYTGRAVGVPTFMLCYEKQPQWTFHHAMAFSLIFGVLPKPVNPGAELAEIHELWKVLENYPITKASWHPYFCNAISVSDNRVKCSYYEAPNGKRLLFAANVSDSPVENVCLDLPADGHSVTNALTGEIVSETLPFTLQFDARDYRVLLI